MNWDDIQKHWPEIKKTLHADHPELNSDRLEKTTEGRHRLLQLIDAKYGAAKPMAEADLDHLMAGNKARDSSDDTDPQ